MTGTGYASTAYDTWGQPAIIIFLLYLYISSAVLLFGAELNAVIEHSCREGKDMGEKVAQPEA